MTNFAIKITYNECVAKCSRHNPSDFNNTFKTLEEAVACVYQNFNEDFTNAQNNNSIELQPCQLTGFEYCGEQAMLEAFQVNPTLDFGDFDIKIKKTMSKNEFAKDMQSIFGKGFKQTDEDAMY